MIELDSDQLKKSVIAVPPVARDENGFFSENENKKIINYLVFNGIKNLMYGGNADFYNVRPSEFKSILINLKSLISDDICMIPSIGPDYGKMIDQTEIIKELGFSTAMILPYMEGGSREEGRSLAIENVSKKLGLPVILYLKNENYLSPKIVSKLVKKNIICGIKYAIVRKNPSEDNFLKELINLVNKELIISGIGEKPVVNHFKDFGLKSFTTGSGSIAPNLSMKLLKSLQINNYEESLAIRSKFLDFEDLRDNYGPSRVLHYGVNSCKIAKLENMQPLWGIFKEEEKDLIFKESTKLFETNKKF